MVFLSVCPKIQHQKSKVHQYSVIITYCYVFFYLAVSLFGLSNEKWDLKVVTTYNAGRHIAA